MRVWKKGIYAPISPTELTVEARQILGILTTCRNPTSRFIARVLGLKASEINEFLTECRSMTHPAIVEIFKIGLNPIAFVSLAGKMDGQLVRCKECRKLLGCVPCIACSCGKDFTDKLSDQIRGEIDLPEPAPTPYDPGSSRKMSLMAYRRKNGFRLFSARDYSLATKTSMQRSRYGE